MAEVRLDVLVLRWYVDRRREPPGVAERWLATCREHLPAALPARFGATEPLRGRLERDGPDGFAGAHAAADTFLFHVGGSPTLGGSLAARPLRHVLGPVGSHSLNVRADAVDEPAVRRFFTAFADGGATVFASASLQRDVIWTGRTLVTDGPAPEEPYLAPLGLWLGLPPRPPVWAWFGPAYARLVRSHLPDPQPTAAGVLHVEPRQWVPEAFTPRLDEPELVRRAAARMPRGLRTSPWRLLFRR